MAVLGALFVHQPLHILSVTIAFALGSLLLRLTGWAARPGRLLLPAAAWALYAGWEALVMVRSPEADIRVDLLVLWPVLAAVSLGCLVWAFRGRRPVGSSG